MKFALFFLISTFLKVNSDFSKNIKKIVNHHLCDPKCTFNHSEITSKTIKSFPKNCDTVCGILIFNENTDLSESEISENFKKMTNLIGSLKMENSNFKSLSFFTKKKDDGVFDLVCEIGEISIQNNPKLEDVSILEDFGIWGDSSLDECPFRIQNNSKLDTSKICEMERFQEWISLSISGNFNDCGCYGGQILKNTSLKIYENCTRMYGGLKFFNFEADSEELSFLSKITVIKGDIEVKNSKLKDLSFLKNVKEIQSKKGKNSKENYVIDLSNNSEMTHFELERMHEIYTAQSDVTTINLENLHPEFCLTFDEVFILLTLKIKFRNIHAKFCENFESTNKKKGLKVCKFDRMEILEFDCEFLFGNVVVDTYNGRHLSNLYNVMVIFGSLKIQYTKLEGLSFLNNLRYIANLNESHPTIFIRSNRYLKQAKLPNLEHVISKNQDSVVISDNAELFSNNQECLMYRITYKTNLKVNNEQCDRSIYKTSISASNFSPFLLFFLYF